MWGVAVILNLGSSRRWSSRPHRAFYHPHNSTLHEGLGVPPTQWSG